MTLAIFEEEKLGATGEFPDGKLNDEDEGELKMAIGIHPDRPDLVEIYFGKQIQYLAFRKQELDLVIEKLIELRKRLA